MLLQRYRGNQHTRALLRSEIQYAPALLLVQLVAHAFRQLFELTLGLCVVCVDHEVLKVPEAPAKVLEPLTLLEEASNLGADLRKH